MNDQILDKILVEIVNIKEQLKDVSTKDDLVVMKNDILGDVDRFVKLHETLDTELASLRNKYSRLEERLELVERKLQIA